MLPKIVGPGNEFGEIMMQRQDQIEAACPDHINIARAITFMNLAIADKPKLRDCTRLSMLKALVSCVTLGLEPNTPLDHAWLIPYKNEVTFQIGYKGLIALAYRSNRIENIMSVCVFAGESFKHTAGLEPKIDHEPRYDIDRTEHTLEFVYSYAYLKGSTRPVYVVLSKIELDTYRARSMAEKKGWHSPWKSDPLPMYRKVGFIRVCTTLPQSPDDKQLFQAISADQTGESYSMNDVVDLEDVEPIEVEAKELTPEELELQKQKDYDEAMRKEQNGTAQ
jgi:recombination protein RecT